MKISIRTIIIVVVATVIVVWVLNNESNREKRIPYEQVCRKNIKKEVRLSGSLSPANKVDIKSRLSGILTDLYVAVGDTIKVGDPIGRVQIIVNPENMERARLNLEKAQINLSRKRKEHERRKILFDKGAVSQEQYEEITSEFQIALRDLESTESQLEILKKGYMDATSEVSDKIVTTISGVVLDLPLKKGSSITERNNLNDGSTIASIANMDEFIFHAMVKESVYPKLKKNQLFSINISALPKLKLKAMISLLHPQGKEENGIVQFPVEATLLPGANYSMLRSGYTATARVVVEEADSVLVINERDVYFKNDSLFVKCLMEDNRITERNIKTGISDGISIQVEEGLELGEKIVKRLSRKSN